MLKLYDSLKKEILDFSPTDGKAFRIYACGPTVYKDLTIGNWRTFLTTDLIRRYLEYRGHEVHLVMNLTDVGHMLGDADTGEDKMELAAKEAGKTPWQIANMYSQKFFDDAKTIGFKPAWKHPRATEHIKEMVAMIETLLAKGLAYATEKGDVYFDVTRAKGYGKLSGNTLDDLKAGARVEINDDKRNPGDFALWIHNPNHVMQWPGPNAIQGYPGWHIECSAMAIKYLGETLDLHIGGEDLKFPHHECEIAQSEGATGETFSKHWLHVKYLMVNGEKMSKSKDNYFTIDGLMEKGYAPEAARALLLSAHYRTPLNFTLAGMDTSQAFIDSLRETAAPYKDAKPAMTSKYENRLQQAMDEDLNVSEALAVMHEFLKEVRKGSVPEDEAARFFRVIDDVFGFDVFKEERVEITADVQALVDARAKAREEKRWADSDALREEIAAKGFDIKDTAKGQEVRKK